MTTGAPPPNFTFDFMSSKRIPPSFSVQPRIYNEAGFVPHPLQAFGQVGGVFDHGRVPVAGATGNVPGGVAWAAAGTHDFTG